MSQIGQDLLDRARAAYEVGDLSGCRELALQGLETQPEDVELLRLLGRADLEAGNDSAEEVLRRLVTLQPDDASAWRDLGTSLLHRGAEPEAAEALREVTRLDPDDLTGSVDLALVSHGLGARGEAVRLLEEVARRAPEDAEPLRHLVDIYRAGGDLEDALRAAQEVERRRPEDVRALLTVADLQLEAGDFDGAVSTYTRLRTLDGEPGHLVYVYHGIIEAEVRAERWRRALDRTIEATGIDRHQLTTDLLSFVAARLFGESEERPSPSRDSLLRRLLGERDEHRRLHDELVT